MSGGFQGYGVDYSRPHGAGTQFRPAQAQKYGSPVGTPGQGGGQSMLNRVNQTLTEVTMWQPHQQPQNQYGGGVGHDYNQYGGHDYHQGDDDEVYEQKPISQLKQFFTPNQSRSAKGTCY